MVLRRVFWQRGLLSGAYHWFVRPLAKTGRWLSARGSLFYLIGTILATIACNVPLNDALAAVDPSSADAGRVWTNYLKNWTMCEQSPHWPQQLHLSLAFVTPVHKLSREEDSLWRARTIVQ